MSIRVVDDGAGGYTLLSRDNVQAGWVRGAAVGVTGFATEDEAIAAAVRAYRALVPWVERNHLKPLVPIREGPMRLVHDGAHRWIAFDNIPIARLPNATPHDRADAAQHAFEIVLRGAVSDGMGIHAALIALRIAKGHVEAAEIAWRPRPQHGVRAGEPPHTRLEAGRR